MDNPSPKFRPVNRVLGAQPSVGPIPGDQVIPWCVLAFLSIVLGRNILDLGWAQTGLIVGWAIGTWWILTGNQAWRFLSKFINVPYVARGHARYISVLDPQNHERQGRKKKVKRSRKKAKSS